MHQSMKLHMHFGRETSLGLKLNVSLEALAVELGVSSQPLQQCYAKYKNRVMWCWLVSLWEKCSKVKTKVHLRSTGISLPREKDRWLMDLFAAKGFTEDELCRLNKVCLYQQVLFLLCVLGVSGKMLDRKYLEKRKDNEFWSKVEFPAEKPPNKDFQLWKAALAVSRLQDMGLKI